MWNRQSAHCLFAYVICHDIFASAISYSGCRLLLRALARVIRFLSRRSIYLRYASVSSTLITEILWTASRVRARTYDARSMASTDEGPILRTSKALFYNIIVVPDTQARYACACARLTRPHVVHASTLSPQPLVLQADTRAEKLKLQPLVPALEWV